MALLVQEPGPLVLAVDVEKLRAHGAQLAHRQGAAIGPANVAAIRRDLPLEEELPLLIRLRPTGGERRKGPRQAGEHRAHKGGAGPGADEVPGGAAPQHRLHGVHHDGLAGAGLAGESVEAGIELDVGGLDHRQILDVQQLQHRLSLLRALQHLPDLLTEELCRVGILHHQEDRVLPGEGAHKTRDIHVVQGLAGTAGKS